MACNKITSSEENNSPRIYFAASVASTIYRIESGSEAIRREKDMWGTQLYQYIKTKGEITNPDLWEGVLKKASEGDTPAREVYDYSITDGVEKSSHVVAEVSRLSHGVGIEIGVAIARKIPVLCLYRMFDKDDQGEEYLPPDSLSRMVRGAPVKLVEYRSVQEAKDAVDQFFSFRDERQ